MLCSKFYLAVDQVHKRISDILDFKYFASLFVVSLWKQPTKVLGLRDGVGWLLQPSVFLVEALTGPPLPLKAETNTPNLPQLHKHPQPWNIQ